MQRIESYPIGRRIAGKRHEHGWTQQQLAIKSGVAIRTLALLETGGRTGLSLGTIKALSEVLGVSLDYLVYGEKQRG